MILAHPFHEGITIDGRRGGVDQPLETAEPRTPSSKCCVCRTLRFRYVSIGPHSRRRQAAADGRSPASSSQRRSRPVMRQRLPRTGTGRVQTTYLNLNVLHTQHLLEGVRGSSSLKRLVYASSSSIYGNTFVERVSEDHLKAPYSPYGVTKLAAEQLCSLYAENFGIPAISLRLIYRIWTQARPTCSSANLISAALTGRRFILHGDGSMQRTLRRSSTW